MFDLNNIFPSTDPQQEQKPLVVVSHDLDPSTKKQIVFLVFGSILFNHLLNKFI